ncbi:MAG: ABC transporter transmembrane domain-containing protein, partial [Acidimicrobiales bacterium]
MSMHGGGGGPAARMGMRSMRQDRSILEHKIKKGTLPRILRFAKHYRPVLIIFLVVVIFDAIISSVSPLLLREIIDVGIYRHRTALVIGLAVTTAILAIGDAGLQMIERRLSAVIGEGLIYDLRAEVFRHIQEMPIAFF